MASGKTPTKRVSNPRRSRPRVPKPRLFDWSRFEPSMARGTHVAELREQLVRYRGHLKELLRDQGKYVLIEGDQVIGIYLERVDALHEAVARFGDQPVLVKQIIAKEPVRSLGGILL